MNRSAPAIAAAGALMLVVRLSAQDAAFEIASIKIAVNPLGGWNLSVPGEAHVFGEPVSALLPLAFEVPLNQRRHRFAATPAVRDLIDSPRFEIHAKGNPLNMTALMLRTLLHDRFGLRTHRETRQVPIYLLTQKEPGRLGRWLKPVPYNCREFITSGGKLGDDGSPRDGALDVCWAWKNGVIKRHGEEVMVSAGTLDELIVQMQPFLDRPVLNGTTLTGNFQWEVAGLLRPNAVHVVLDEQLGLKLERQVGPYEVIVIDALSMPTPN